MKKISAGVKWEWCDRGSRAFNICNSLQQNIYNASSKTFVDPLGYISYILNMKENNAELEMHVGQTFRTVIHALSRNWPLVRRNKFRNGSMFEKGPRNVHVRAKKVIPASALLSLFMNTNEKINAVHSPGRYSAVIVSAALPNSKSMIT